MHRYSVLQLYLDHMLESSNHIPPGPSLSVPTIRKLHSNSQNFFIIETNTDLSIRYLDMFWITKRWNGPHGLYSGSIHLTLRLRFNCPSLVTQKVVPTLARLTGSEPPSRGFEIHSNVSASPGMIAHEISR